MPMSEEEAALGLSGKIVLARLNSAELELWLTNMSAQTAEFGPFNANNWLVVAGASLTGPEDFWRGQRPAIRGDLWRLWNGQNFWTSKDGRFFSASLKEN